MPLNYPSAFPPGTPPPRPRSSRFPNRHSPQNPRGQRRWLPSSPRRLSLYHSLLLPDSSLCRLLGLLSPACLSLLGIGNLESSPAARLQLVLASLLLRDLLPDASAPADLFDPVLSAAECAAATALGFSVPTLNEGCHRRAGEPTLFYMPHCEVSLYDALLAANWESPAQLRQLCVLGNSFRRYALQAEENGSGPATKVKHVLTAERFAWDMQEDDMLAHAFNETSWHFFEVDDGMDSAIASGRLPRLRRRKEIGKTTKKIVLKLQCQSCKYYS